MMEAFLTFILVAVALFYLLGYIGRWLIRRWIRNKQREFERRFNSGAGGFGTGYGSAGAAGGRTADKEGEVKIYVSGTQQKKANRNVGEYVEYEEVEINE